MFPSSELHEDVVNNREVGVGSGIGRNVILVFTCVMCLSARRYDFDFDFVFDFVFSPLVHLYIGFRLAYESQITVQYFGNEFLFFVYNAK